MTNHCYVVIICRGDVCGASVKSQGRLWMGWGGGSPHACRIRMRLGALAGSARRLRHPLQPSTQRPGLSSPQPLRYQSSSAESPVPLSEVADRKGKGVARPEPPRPHRRRPRCPLSQWSRPRSPAADNRCHAPSSVGHPPCLGSLVDDDGFPCGREPTRVASSHA